MGRPEASAVAHGRSGMADPCPEQGSLCPKIFNTACCAHPPPHGLCVAARGMGCAPLPSWQHTRGALGLRLWLNMCRHRGRILYGEAPILMFCFSRQSGSPESMSVFSAGCRGTRQATPPFTAPVGRPEAPAMACNRWCMAHPCHMR